jgi:hypothetical protein
MRQRTKNRELRTGGGLNKEQRTREQRTQDRRVNEQREQMNKGAKEHNDL